MRAMILAAGLGARLDPITKEIPKPLAPILGVPNIVRIIFCLKAAGIEEIVINTYWLGEVLERALGDGGKLGVSIAYSREKTLLGTGGGIKKALPLLGKEPFLAINGDALFAPDIESVIERSSAFQSLATLVVRRDPEASRYGAVGLDAQGRVRYLVSEGDRSKVEESFMFTGMHIIDPAIGNALPDEGCIVRKTYISMIRTGSLLYAVPLDGYFCDLGTPTRYHAANMSLVSGLEKMPGVAAPPDGIYLGEQVELGAGSRLLPGAVIGDRARIAPGIQVERSVVFEGASVAEDLTDAIVTSRGEILRIGKD